MQTHTLLYKDRASLSIFIEQNNLKNAKHIFVQIYTGTRKNAFIESLVKQLRFLIPQVRIAGATKDGETINGGVTTEQTVLSFSIFDHNDLELFGQELEDRDGLVALSQLVKASTQELAHLNQSLEESEQRYKSLFEHNPNLIYSMDRKGRITSANPALEKELGYTLEEIFQTQSSEYIADDELLVTNQHFKKTLEGKPQHYPLKIKHKDGHELLFDVTNLPIVVNEKIVGVYGIAQNMTKQKEDQEKIIRLAYHDELTGLPNRILFQQMLESTIHDAKRRSTKLAVMFIDIDDFKMINDSVGHHLGDKIIKQVADRMKKVLAEKHFLSRFNGDEFVLLAPDIQGMNEAVLLSQKVLQSLGSAIICDGREFYISASAGISMIPDDALDGDTALKNADTALYHAKLQGRAKIKTYKREMNDQMVDRLELESYLRKALKKGEFSLVYQPQICTDTGKICGSEALIRWNHPKLGAVSPVQFIPLAEETGLIDEIGQWVLKTACLQVKEWHRKGYPDCWVSVNVSGGQFQRRDFFDEVKAALRESGLSPQCLHLELTESITLRDIQYSIQLVNVLRELGVKVSIDDFGTGYSSLSYLKDFAIDILKIDRSFVRNLKNGNQDGAIVKAILTMCEGLSVTAVAEGVENREQLDVLKSFGCGHVQGFYYSKPLPPEKFEHFLSQRKVPS